MLKPHNPPTACYFHNRTQVIFWQNSPQWQHACKTARAPTGDKLSCFFDNEILDFFFFSNLPYHVFDADLVIGHTRQ